MLIEEALKESGAVIAKDGAKLVLKQSSSPDLTFYGKDNKPVSFDDFSDQVLASKKVLAVSEDKKSSNTTTLPQITGIPTLGGGKTTSFDATIQRLLNDLKEE
jgi:hypothetical protein